MEIDELSCSLAPTDDNLVEGSTKEPSQFLKIWLADKASQVTLCQVDL